MNARSFRFMLALFCIAVFVVACGGDLQIQDSYEPVTPTPPPSSTPEPTVVSEFAETIGLAFYREWENGNYSGMYSLISGKSQGLVTLEDFTNRYQRAIDEARVLSVKALPRAVNQDGNSAELAVQVTWETAIVGTIVRDHNMLLEFADNRWGIIWNEGLIMPELAGGNSLRLNIQVPSRASLKDRGDETLAFQGAGIVLGVIPGRLVDEAGFLQAVSTVTGKATADIQSLYANVPLDWYVPIDVVPEARIQEYFFMLEPYFENGLQAQDGFGRLYTDTGVAPHLIGYMGFIPEGQADRYWADGYRTDERVGITGLEAAAEPYLGGERGGQLWIIGPGGEEVGLVQEAQSIPGRVVHTTFDSAFQLAVQQALEDAITSHPNGHSGAVVVMDANTGAIRAMASYPTYDAAVFSEIRPNSDSEITSLLNDPSRPLVNRATQGQYPPGSTFKIVTSAAGLHSGQFTADQRYYCSGSWDELGSALIKFDWKLEGHGSVDLIDLIEQSCNTYSYHIGYTLDTVDPFILANMAREFGMASRLGIEIPESAGFIPDPETKLTTFGDGWSPGDSVNMAIGQGFVETTPLQIAAMTAAVANGGTLYQPTLIERVEASTSAPEQIFPPTVIRQLPLSQDHITALRLGMNDATSGDWGTARRAVAGLTMSTGGKTGTAQVAGENSEPHAWFTGFAPFEEPEIVVTVIVENAGEGSQVAAPIFRRVLDIYYEFEPIPYPWLPQQ